MQKFRVRSVREAEILFAMKEYLDKNGRVPVFRFIRETGFPHKEAITVAARHGLIDKRMKKYHQYLDEKDRGYKKPPIKKNRKTSSGSERKVSVYGKF